MSCADKYEVDRALVLYAHIILKNPHEIHTAQGIESITVTMHAVLQTYASSLWSVIFNLFPCSRILVKLILIFCLATL